MSVNILFYIFASLICVTALLSIISKNSVHSVLYLVLTFFSSAWIMLLLNAEFIAMLLIIVYVGAIAVLFLFVVMMLQTKYNHKPSNIQTSTSVLIACIIFSQVLSFLTFKTAKKQELISFEIPFIEVSKLLYLENFANFQFVGLILLIAMVAVILLTTRNNNIFIKKQNITNQVLRTKEDCIINTKPQIGQGIKL